MKNVFIVVVRHMICFLSCGFPAGLVMWGIAGIVALLGYPIEVLVEIGGGIPFLIVFIALCVVSYYLIYKFVRKGF